MFSIHLTRAKLKTLLLYLFFRPENPPKVTSSLLVFFSPLPPPPPSSSYGARILWVRTCALVSIGTFFAGSKEGGGGGGGGEKGEGEASPFRPFEDRYGGLF